MGALVFLMLSAVFCETVARSIAETLWAVVWTSDSELVYRDWRGRESRHNWAELDGVRVTRFPRWSGAPTEVALLIRGTVLRLPKWLDGPEEFVEEAIARAGLSMVTRTGLSTRYERPELATDAPRGS